MLFPCYLKSSIREAIIKGLVIAIEFLVILSLIYIFIIILLKVKEILILDLALIPILDNF